MATSRGMLALLCAFVVFGVLPLPCVAQSPSDSCDVAVGEEPRDDALLAALDGQELANASFGDTACIGSDPAPEFTSGQVDMLADAGTTQAVNPLAIPAAADQLQPADSSAAAPPKKLTIKTDMGSPLVWKRAGGDPAGIPREEQIKYLPVWGDVAKKWDKQLRTVHPDTVWIVSTVEKPTYLDVLTWGGRRNNVFKVRGPVKIDLRDSTGAHIDSVQALQWPAVVHENEEYVLLQFLVCTNVGYYKCTAPPEAEMPPEEPPQEPPVAKAPPDSIPSEPPPEEPPTVETPPEEIPFEPADAANIVVNGTAWLTGEFVDGKNGGNHTNGFTGTEIIVRKSYGDHNLGLVLRAGGGAIGQPDANGSFQTAGGLLRAGLRLPLKDPTEWGIAAEAGGYTDAQQLVWRDERFVTPTHMHWQERRNTVSDAGAYLRTVGYGPRTLTWDARLGTGKRLRHEIEASASGSPRPRIQVRAGFHENRYKDRTVNGPDREFTFPNSTFRTLEGFVGYRPKLNHVVSIGWKEWKYHSPIWEFDWQGPAVAYDWKINMPWRFRGEATRFSDTREYDPRSHLTDTNDHTRITLGLNYDF